MLNCKLHSIELKRSEEMLAPYAGSIEGVGVLSSNALRRFFLARRGQFLGEWTSLGCPARKTGLFQRGDAKQRYLGMEAGGWIWG